MEFGAARSAYSGAFRVEIVAAVAASRAASTERGTRPRSTLIAATLASAAASGFVAARLMIFGLRPCACGSAAAARPSRTRMAAKPKIINLAAPKPEAAANAKVAAIRVERGRVPRSVEAARDTPAAVAISTRNAPL